MKLKIEIEMDNAAFESGNGAEAARILRFLASRINDLDLNPSFGWKLTDFNGNRVGKAEVGE